MRHRWDRFRLRMAVLWVKITGRTVVLTVRGEDMTISLSEKESLQQSGTVTTLEAGGAEGRGGADMRKPRSDDRGLVLRYDRVRSSAQLLQSKFKASPGGDEYVYTGSMNQVEALRDALDDLEAYMRFNDIRMPDDTPGGEHEDES